MRAGRPWNATRSRARRIQRWSDSSWGKRRRIVRDADVLGVAGERRPAERAAPDAELRADVRGHEAGEREGVRESGVGRALADVVAVVEGPRAAPLERDHQLDVAAHRVHRARDVAVGIAPA
jgi:hypothetical protein